ncbi:uncharacterized protein GBIM_11474, partial [Gryllus bimaculatus]
TDTNERRSQTDGGTRRDTGARTGRGMQSPRDGRGKQTDRGRRTSFWPLSQAAINTKCTEHVEDLFELGYRPKYLAKEGVEGKRHTGQGPFEGGHWAAAGALTAPMKIRITHLAVPRRHYSRCTKKYHGYKLSEKQRKILDVYIDNATKTVYYLPKKKKVVKPKKRPKTEGVGFKWPKPKPKGKKPPRQIDMERLTKLAVPRPIPPPPDINRGEKVTIEELGDGLSRLATPPRRMKVKKVNFDKIYQVKRGALEYTISDRVAEIAQPKPYFGPPPFKPFIVSRAALHYQASERVNKIATPRERKGPPTDDLKEDPFTVLPIALKAMCTPRTAELAQPRVRK